mgnify:CR=1 FL=1
MNNRTDNKLKDISGMSKAVNELVNQAWERGYKYGLQQDREPLKPEWLGFNDGNRHKWSCSCCGRGVVERENYCPNCGVDMRASKHRPIVM